MDGGDSFEFADRHVCYSNAFDQYRRTYERRNGRTMYTRPLEDNCLECKTCRASLRVYLGWKLWICLEFGSCLLLNIRGMPRVYVLWSEYDALIPFGVGKCGSGPGSGSSGLKTKPSPWLLMSL